MSSQHVINFLRRLAGSNAARQSSSSHRAAWPSACSALQLPLPLLLLIVRAALHCPARSFWGRKYDGGDTQYQLAKITAAARKGDRRLQVRLLFLLPRCWYLRHMPSLQRMPCPVWGAPKPH